MDKMRMESMDLAKIGAEKIGQLFPNCVTETRDAQGNWKKTVNLEMLRQMLAEEAAEGPETYEFTWPGKRAAIAKANAPTRKTLRPAPEKSVRWEGTKNLYLEGDNVDALKLLQKGYMGKVQVIYIDPPYNTGNDSFVYPDDFSESQREHERAAGVRDMEENRVFTENPGTHPRFHSRWCSMIFERLLLARNLLADDGVIFLSIDDNEKTNLMKICDEVFGENQFVAVFPRLTTKSGKTPLTYMVSHDYVLCYVKLRKDIFVGKTYADDSYKYEDEFVAERGKYNLKQPLDCNSISYAGSLDYPIEHEGVTYYPGSDPEKYRERKSGKHAGRDYAWRWSKELYEFGLANGWIVFQNGRIYTKGYLNAAIEKNPAGGYQIVYREKTRKMSTIDFIDNAYSNDAAKKQLAAYQIPVRFDYPKPTELIEELLASYYDKNALVMDFFSGSATAADAVIRQNARDGGERTFLLVQYPEETGSAAFPTICDMAQERIRRAGGDFRVFRVDASNMKETYFLPQEYSFERLQGLEANIKEDRTAMDLLFGCVLDWGLPLTISHQEQIIDGCTVHICGGRELIACFDENIPEEVIAKMAQGRPRCAVFRDGCFLGSPEKINVEEIFRRLSPGTRIKVI